MWYIKHMKLLVFLLFISNFAFAKQSEESFNRMLVETERFRAKPYDDLTGKTLSYFQLNNGKYEGTPTIGYGTVIPKKWFEKKWLFRGISKKTARRWAKNHPVRRLVEKKIKKVNIKLTQDQEDVLHEAGYNIGAAAIGRIVKTLNTKGLNAAAKHLSKFTRAKGKILPGLVKRRNEEAKRLRGNNGK